MPDHYKNRGISLYDPSRAPLLNQYRLLVPRTHNIIETVQFVILLILYVLMMINREHTLGPKHLQYTIFELVFDIYSIGWVLDEIASVLEHGWTVHTENLWSFLDITFVLIFCTYFGVRVHGFIDENDHSHAQSATNIISMAAPILLPRLAFCLMPENMLFISLRAMMADFMFLTLLAVWCFGGFLMALRWLSEGQEGYVPEDHGLITIAKWMLWIWFGLDGTGVQRSSEMHWLLGPTLMVLFAFLGNSKLDNSLPGKLLCASKVAIVLEQILTPRLTNSAILDHPCRHAQQYLHLLGPQRYGGDSIPQGRSYVRRGQVGLPFCISTALELLGADNLAAVEIHLISTL